MSIIEYPIYDTTLLFEGHFKIWEKVEDIKNDLEKTFDDIFIDWENNWPEIYDILEMFGNSGIIEYAAGSKWYSGDEGGDPTVGGQGDSNKTQYRQKTDLGTLTYLSQIFNRKNLLKDSSLEISWDLTQEDSINLEKWMGIAQSFQSLQDSLQELMYYCFLITPLYESEGSLSRSPVQMKLYKSSLMKTSLSAPEGQYGNTKANSVLHRAPLSITDYSFAYDSFINTLQKDEWLNLISLSINRTWTFTTEISSGEFDSSVPSLRLPDNTVHLDKMVVWNTTETSACSGYSLEDIDAGVVPNCTNIVFVGSHNMRYDAPIIDLTTDARNHLDEDPGGKIDLYYKTITVT